MISEQNYQLECTLDLISSDTRFSGEKVGSRVKGFTSFIGGCSPPTSGSPSVQEAAESVKGWAVGP